MKKLIQLILFVVPLVSMGQSLDSSLNLQSLSEKYIGRIERNVKSFSNTVERKTLASLQKFQHQEEKLQKKLAGKDSLVAKQLFNVQNRYQELTTQLKNPLSYKTLSEYIPHFDSLKTAFSFLDKSQSLSSKFPKEWSEKIKGVNDNMQGLESKLQQANEVKAFIKERRQQIKEQLERYGLGKELKKLNKEVYYYQQQLNEYKAMLHDPKKIEQKALAKLNKLPAFTAFMKKNSMLAQLFKVPEGYGSPESLAGLQTTASVRSLIQDRFAGSGVNSQQYVQQQMQQATTALNKLKDKVNKLGGSGSGDIEMPDFNPNQQKTKSFLKRIEYGANIQSQKTNVLLPVTSDLALTAGYKLNDKSVLGVGASYKVGWGTGINHIHLSHQGVGLRSYIDVKIKGNIWISGGYEQNYQHAFVKVEQLRQYKAWQTSGLIGLTKKYKLGKKTNSFQMLWDFFSQRQHPTRQPFVFRIGYLLK